MSERLYKLAGGIFGATLESGNGATRAVRITNGNNRRRVLVEFVQDGLVMDGVRRRVCVVRSGEAMHVSIDGEVSVVEALSDFAGTANHVGGDEAIYAPMPGQIVMVYVRAGQQVAAGDTLVTLESMKLHSNLTAPTAGVVCDLAVEPGANVEKGNILLRIIPTEGAGHAQN